MIKEIKLNKINELESINYGNKIKKKAEISNSTIIFILVFLIGLFLLIIITKQAENFKELLLG